MAQPLGFIISQGNSIIDGKPYVAIMTLKTTNRKTGDMAQVWILRSDINPVEAVNTGGDRSICGDCPHRKQADGSRSCYVNVGQAPNSIYKSYKNGRYKVGSRKQIKAVVTGRKVRWGAYGDPSIIPVTIVKEINSYSSGWTGYTHQWKESWCGAFKGIFQASCDGLMEYLDATAHGWKTFSVLPKGYVKNTLHKHVRQCPATFENSVATCSTCSLCDGNKLDIYVEAHGSGAKHVTTFA